MRRWGMMVELVGVWRGGESEHGGVERISEDGGEIEGMDEGGGWVGLGVPGVGA